jgi:hypothetical protein
MALQDYIKNGRVLVRREAYAIIKAKASMPGALAVICDDNEITVVIDQSRIEEEHIIEIEKDWRLLTFDMVLPLDLVGFLAEVSQVLADEGVTIFSLSAYSTDHILVKEKNIGKAIEGLEGVGFTIDSM